MALDRKPVLCIVDDDALHNQALCGFLRKKGYDAISFDSAVKFMEDRSKLPACDLIISDIRMPGMSGYELCAQIRADREGVRVPIILITGNHAADEKAHGLELGADEFIGKPYPAADLLAKIKSLLDIQTREQARLNKFTQFLSPNIAALLSNSDQQALLKPHRSEVTVLFVDLRRFTAFSEHVAPEEVLEVLGRYYTIVGNAAMKYRGTLGHLAGDGIMVFFNDPEPIANHKQVAIQMAMEAVDGLVEERKMWRERGYDIDFGMGLCEGFATIGGIGFNLFSQYSVIGTVTNFASRLCHVAGDGQVLISHRFMSQLDPVLVKVESVGEIPLKGIEMPVTVYNVLSFEKISKVS